MNSFPIVPPHSLPLHASHRQGFADEVYSARASDIRISVTCYERRVEGLNYVHSPIPTRPLSQARVKSSPLLPDISFSLPFTRTSTFFSIHIWLTTLNHCSCICCPTRVPVILIYISGLFHRFTVFAYRHMSLSHTSALVHLFTTPACKKHNLFDSDSPV